MTTFTVWKFDNPDGAEHAQSTLTSAEAEGLVKLVDHAVLTWPTDADQPTLHHEEHSAKRGAAWGGFLGVLGGALFAIPVAGLALGAGVGALARATDAAGITKHDLERVRSEVTRGTSALFLVTEEADLDRLGERFRGRTSTLLTTNLTDAERATLLETFGGE